MSDPIPAEPQSPQQKKVIRLYAAFGVSLIISLIPTLSAVLIFLLSIMAVVIYAYILRGKAEPGDLMENHATFIIRTFWIVNLFALLTIACGSTYMLMEVDNAPLMPCADALINMDPSRIAGLDNNTLMDMFRPCIEDYTAVNRTVLIIAGVITALPLIIYLVVRYVRGLSRALKGYRVASPKAWF